MSNSICEQWILNKNKNPRTGRTIKNTGKVYKDLQRECEPTDVKQTTQQKTTRQKTTRQKKTTPIISDADCRKWFSNRSKNPITGKPIKPTGKVYKDFAKQCNFNEVMNFKYLLNKAVETVDIPTDKVLKFLDILTINPDIISEVKKLKNVKTDMPAEHKLQQPPIKERPPPPIKERPPPVKERPPLIEERPPLIEELPPPIKEQPPLIEPMEAPRKKLNIPAEMFQKQKKRINWGLAPIPTPNPTNKQLQTMAKIKHSMATEVSKQDLGVPNEEKHRRRAPEEWTNIDDIQNPLHKTLAIIYNKLHYAGDFNNVHTEFFNIFLNQYLMIYSHYEKYKTMIKDIKRENIYKFMSTLYNILSLDNETKVSSLYNYFYTILTSRKITKLDESELNLVINMPIKFYSNFNKLLSSIYQELLKYPEEISMLNTFYVPKQNDFEVYDIKLNKLSSRMRYIDMFLTGLHEESYFLYEISTNLNKYKKEMKESIFDLLLNILMSNRSVLHKKYDIFRNYFKNDDDIKNSKSTLNMIDDIIRFNNDMEENLYTYKTGKRPNKLKRSAQATDYEKFYEFY